jgi:hypothetical protein
MREWILRERKNELALEGDRFWTLNRRLMTEQEQYRKIMKLSVDANDGGAGFAFTDFYNVKELTTNYWDAANPQKMYLWPIPQGEIDKARGIVQNPGW